MVLIIDPSFSGLSGNMFIGAFIDLGADSSKIIDVIKNYANEFGSVDIDIRKVSKCGVITTFADITTTDTKSRHYTEIISKIDEITEEKYPDDQLIKKSIELAKKIFKTLAIAESKAHNKPLEELHFHEVGLADAVADIIASSYAYHLLDLDKEFVYSMPVATGSGTVKTQHGILPVPAVSVLNILEDVPITGGIPKTELATPTGCAILVNIVDKYVDSYPTTRNRIVGYGAGKKDLEVLNALRIILASDNKTSDTVTVLETNVDTLSGEILGSLFDTLLSNNARDVTITPIIMKKNRPAHKIEVICKDEDSDKLLDILMKETGSLGVRINKSTHRGVAKRKIITQEIDINGSIESVNFKVGYLSDNTVIKYTPEYEDVKRISEKIGIPLKDVMDIINRKCDRIE